MPIPSYLAGSIRLSEVLSYPVYRIAVAGLCVALALAMMFVIQKTRVGRMIRAGESNREMVEALGIDTRLLFRFVFAAGVSLAAAAGIIAAPIESVYPGIGEQVLIISFVVVVIGGIGSIKGALRRRAADRARRRLRQGVPAAVRERDGLCPDGGRAGGAAGRPVRAGMTC